MPKHKPARKPDRREPASEVAAVEIPESVEGLTPRSLRRRQEILDAATALFLEKGFSGCSIDDVIDRTGGSKRTVYKLFPCKHDLFTAIAGRVAQKILRPIEISFQADRPIEAALSEFGENLLAVVTSKEFCQHFRGVTCEVSRFPDAVRDVFEAGPIRINAALGDLLARYEERGDIVLEDRKLAASQFVGMLRNERMYAVALGLMPPPDKAAIKRIVSQAVEIFLNGCRRRN